MPVSNQYAGSFFRGGVFGHSTQQANRTSYQRPTGPQGKIGVAFNPPRLRGLCLQARKHGGLPASRMANEKPSLSGRWELIMAR